MNEETILEYSAPQSGGQSKKNRKSWKPVTLGGISAILIGAGAMFAKKAYGKESLNIDAGSEGNTSDATSEVASTSVDNGLSFNDAFAQARAALGPNGVFEWKGGIYSTHTAEEWNAMNNEQQNQLVEQVNPQTPAEQIPTPTDESPQIDIVSDGEETGGVEETEESEEEPMTEPINEGEGIEDNTEPQATPVVDEQTAENFQLEGVHVVGYADADGHLAVGYDTTGDGQTDVAIIDVDDNHEISDPDLVVNDQGDVNTVAELLDEVESEDSAEGEDVVTEEEVDPYLTSLDDNPDVGEDMPDYMDNALI